MIINRKVINYIADKILSLDVVLTFLCVNLTFILWVQYLRINFPNIIIFLVLPQPHGYIFYSLIILIIWLIGFYLYQRKRSYEISLSKDIGFGISIIILLPLIFGYIRSYYIIWLFALFLPLFFFEYITENGQNDDKKLKCIISNDELKYVTIEQLYNSLKEKSSQKVLWMYFKYGVFLVFIWNTLLTIDFLNKKGYLLSLSMVIITFILIGLISKLIYEIQIRNLSKIINNPNI